MGGRPVQIVVNRNGSFELDEKVLENILLQDHIKDKNVVVVSVAGAFGRGKSFLLNFLLRYLEAKGRQDWMGNEDEPLQGFSWEVGSERHTTGILIWSEVFVVDLPNREQVAVILMDTQGAFSKESSMQECTIVFALSTLLSSVQIYNLMNNIQENHLQYLELFADYGKKMVEDSNEKPFQKLQFLVRDWSYPYEADYGDEGGEIILNRMFEESGDPTSAPNLLRKHLKSCFLDMCCFLMPHPGTTVTTNPEFDGKLSDIGTDFKKQLQKLVPMMLAPENLVVKEIGGQRVTAKELLQYFKSYLEIYKGDELPEPKSILVATAEVHNLTAVAEATETYTMLMEGVCGGAKPHLSRAKLKAEHRKCKNAALIEFQNKPKIGGMILAEPYKKKLEEELERLYEHYKENNESKSIFKAVRSLFYSLKQL
ncbi:atlastin-like [Zootermopsis nevadensis]|uniref:Atlastin n=1 Tax=Zootermopsis nevadensis TaxID=136037 RepID=A0A067QX25_ZOONE|nr:atlastin-like [Zootermopsis nevadensis]KDR14875.1 Atlastin [Zootermopsis nevadensis]